MSGQMASEVAFYVFQSPATCSHDLQVILYNRVEVNNGTSSVSVLCYLNIYFVIIYYF